VPTGSGVYPRPDTPEEHSDIAEALADALSGAKAEQDRETTDLLRLAAAHLKLQAARRASLGSTREDRGAALVEVALSVAAMADRLDACEQTIAGLPELALRVTYLEAAARYSAVQLDRINARVAALEAAGGRP
jgi:hypothetical protein